MEECMEEEEMLTYEAMMDDQNHNNWEAAADNFRQPPPPPPSSSVPDPGRDPPGGSADRKGPKEGLPMGPPPLPEPNGVIMMLKSCDAAAAFCTLSRNSELHPHAMGTAIATLKLIYKISSQK
ncbi:CDK2 associated cullin domain 1 [Cricetulus griseus]